MPRVQIDAVGLEFEEGGKTIWVHGPEGTILRIKCSGQISIKCCGHGGSAHADIQVQGDIAFCIPESDEEEVTNVH